MDRSAPPLRRLVTLATAAVLVVGACGGDDDAPDTAGTAGPTTSETTTATSEAPVSTESEADPVPLGEVALAVESIGTFEVPTAYRVHPDGTAYVSEKAGRILEFSSGDVVLDVSDQVRDDGEQGFLGFDFSDQGDRLYVSYSDPAGDSMVEEYAFVDGAADPATARTLLQIDQPFGNHNGGDVHVGPDGLLYLAFGDGGSSGDPEENGQDTSTLLGSILRIDPSAPADGRPYGIPADNPFVAGGGAAEIYLYGVRNPWRIAFDTETDDLWVADVGQNQWEEVTVLPADDGAGLGANLGWNQVEGTHEFDGAAPDGAVPPVFEYDHDQGCSITGGFVYRGASIPGLDGAYLFADLCRTTVRALRADGDQLVEERTFDVDVGTPIAFGIDPDGEMVVLSQTGDVFRIVPG